MKRINNSCAVIAKLPRLKQFRTVAALYCKQHSLKCTRIWPYQWTETDSPKENPSQTIDDRISARCVMREALFQLKVTYLTTQSRPPTPIDDPEIEDERLYDQRLSENRPASIVTTKTPGPSRLFLVFWVIV